MPGFISVSTALSLIIDVTTLSAVAQVGECLTRDRGVGGLSLTGVTVLWTLSKTHLS